MKNIRKILALVLALVMVLAMGAAAFAEGDKTTTTVSADTAKGGGAFTITMTGAEDGHRFTAYKIFEGAVDKSGKLSDISWAAGVNSAAIATGLAAIEGFPTTVDGKTLDLTKAEDVAAALTKLTDDAAIVQKAADVFYANKGAASGTVEAKTDDNYVIDKQTAGYYLVVDEYVDTPAEGAATLSRNILAVVGDVTAEVKNDKPSVEKKILDPTPKDANEAGIGDTVAFQIESKVPNYTGYDKYYFVINDKLSNGLTFDGKQNLVVKVEGRDTALVEDEDYEVKLNDDGYTFRIGFKNIMGFDIGKKITVTYTATVNENAKIGNEGNTNETDVQYSNNPNDTSDGTPGDNPFPGEDTPVGQSPKDVTVTYVSKVVLNKYKDEVKDSNKLAGATFTLTGTTKTVKGKGADIYVADADGAYWKLTDGTYTTTAPHGDIKDAQGNVKVESNEDAYDSTTQKYALQHVTEYEEETKDVFMQGTSGEDGQIEFTGLGAGTYTLTEVVTPAGYNTAEPITFTITITVPDTITTGKESATFDSNNDKVSLTETSGVFETDVVDKSGSTLPSTGGIGTTIFYVGGSILVLAAVILLVTKRRMSAGE